jgi:hypothetical protein
LIICYWQQDAFDRTTYYCFGHSLVIGFFTLKRILSRGRARRPLIDSISNRERQRAGTGQEDTARELLFKSGLQRPGDTIAAALLNAYHTATRTGNEIILHTKKF